jgi:poly(hydroxyalkanoate) depolymerase family esterase
MLGVLPDDDLSMANAKDTAKDFPMKWPHDLRLDTTVLRDMMRHASSRLGTSWGPPPTPFSHFAAGTGGVLEVPSFGHNPGKLRMRLYAPEIAPRAGSPLIVVLHGCHQDASAFAADSGWIQAADRLGVPLLLPEQRAENNRGGCFNWFRPGDITRGHGEAASIYAMTVETTRRFASDKARVFVVGLSAGGAMAAALLAAYPDVFAAGAVVAGLPVGCADTVPAALARMSNAGPIIPAPALAERARRFGPPDYAAAWPRLSVWHGEADRTVDPGNGRALARQWAALHASTETVTRKVDGARLERWGDDVELWTLPNLEHGYPITPDHPNDGRAARYVLDAPVSATDRVLRFWGVERAIA